MKRKTLLDSFLIFGLTMSASSSSAYSVRNSVNNSAKKSDDNSSARYSDVIVVGAGLSGICLAYHFKLQEGLSLQVLECRKDVGGMWDEFNFPGLRTDTAAPLYEYSFHPLPQSSLVMPTRDELVAYLRDVVETYQLRDNMIFGVQVRSANFDTTTGRWTLTTSTPGEVFHCKFYVSCVGYFDLYKPYIPKFPGASTFQGPIVHTNSWSQQDPPIDYKGKRVLIIGSGSTTVTVAPAIAKEAEQVVVLQRSPGYIGEAPLYYESTSLWSLGSKLVSKMSKGGGLLSSFWKKLGLLFGRLEFARANQRALESARKRLESNQAWGPVLPGESTDERINESQEQIEHVVSRFPNLRRHFTPSYYLFEQRQCFASGGDYLNAIESGNIEILTAEIEKFTESGVRLKPLSEEAMKAAQQAGERQQQQQDEGASSDNNNHVNADIIVLATGLNLKFMSGIQLSIDGRPQNTGETVAYRGGLMMSGIPNLFNIGGYFKGPYTRRVELQVPFILSIVDYMRENNCKSVTPKWAGSLADDIDRMPNVNFLTSAVGHTSSTGTKNSNQQDWRGPKYVQRDESASSKPRVGKTNPWRGGWNYYEDYVEFQKASPNDGTLEYS